MSRLLREEKELIYKYTFIFTGLKVNVSKSEVLLIQNNLPPAVIERVSKFGVIKPSVMHLGVDISTDYDVGYNGHVPERDAGYG